MVRAAFAGPVPHRLANQEDDMQRLLPALTLALIAASQPAFAQMGPGGPPAVGVVRAEMRPMTESSEFVGRVQAINRVALVPRITAFLEQRLFTEGAEVKKGDLLYRLEQGPSKADLQAKQAAVAQANAQLQNATITLNRAQSLLNTPAGQRSVYDDALANQRSQAAQLLAAQAQLANSQINLSYTEIRAPIDGEISRTLVTEGNAVNPSSGTLATIVSQDPMYVLFPVSVRSELELSSHYASKGGFGAVVVKLKLPDGKPYAHAGRLDYVDPTVATNTDTVTLRAVIPNPTMPGATPGQPGSRELVDGEFVTVEVQGIEPVQVLAIPRSAVVSDQLGDYVWIVDAEKKAQRQPVTLGQSTATLASVIGGLKPGQMVIVDGIQRVRPGQPVNPAPAPPGPTAEASVLQGGSGAGGK
jgi:membrane fusion protein (multidrug efflux system)